MFNFGEPPANLRNIRTRVGVSSSDTGLSRNQRATDPNALHNYEADPVTLPPLIKASKSAPHVQTAPKASHSQFPKNLLPHHHIPQPHYVHPQPPVVGGRGPPEGRKLPSHREMIYLTLKHVQSARGLTFDQIYSFISGAFEMPRSFNLESKLRKTLSNMNSKGVVTQNPGLEPRYVTYQLRQMEPESSLDLSVSGKSVPNVSSWPTSFSLPNGSNLLCRTGNVRKDVNPNLGLQRQGYRRNPMAMRLQPMAQMPIGDPMICQSFGARAGLKFKNEQRPNSPNSGDDDDDDDRGEPNPSDNGHYCEKSWVSFPSEMTRNAGEIPLSRNVKSPPRMLNTYNPEPNEDEESNQHLHYSSHSNNPDQTEAAVQCNVQLSSNAEPSVPPERMFTATKYTESWQTYSKNNNNKEEPLSNFDIFAQYNGETYKEYEMNNRSCHIMNDLGRSRIPLIDDEGEKEMMSPKLNGADRMDYLLGIADIIDSYGEEPPELTKSGKRSRPSKGKTAGVSRR